MPLAGARFDQTFVGALRGPKLYGEILGRIISLCGQMGFSNCTCTRAFARKIM